MLNACDTEEGIDMIRRKWKVNEIIPIAQGNYWNLETGVLDLSQLPDSKNETKPMYFQRIGGRNLIKFKHSPFHMEVLDVSSNKLKIRFYGMDSTTGQDHLMAELNCIPMND